MTTRPVVVLLLVSMTLCANAAPAIYQDVLPEYHVGDTVYVRYGPYLGGLIGLRVMLSVDGGHTFPGCIDDQWYGLDIRDTAGIYKRIPTSYAVCDTEVARVRVVSDSCVIGIVDRDRPQDTAMTSMFRILPAVSVQPQPAAAIRARAEVAGERFDVAGRRVPGVPSGVSVVRGRCRVWIPR